MEILPQLRVILPLLKVILPLLRDILPLLKVILPLLRDILHQLRVILLQPICLQDIRLQEVSLQRQFLLPIRPDQRLFLCRVYTLFYSKEGNPTPVPPSYPVNPSPAPGYPVVSVIMDR